MSDPEPGAEPKAKKPRLESLDAFRGLTILGMIFVIQAAGYHHLPLTFPHFGSAPVSTWKHAGEDGEPSEWAFWEGKEKSTIYHEAKVVSCAMTDAPGFKSPVASLYGPYDVALVGEKDKPGETFKNVRINSAKPLRTGDSVIAVRQSEGQYRFQGVGNGCTLTDLVAPFFVFIVGMCLPLSRQRRGADWWKHVGTRTLGLILLGVLYISLILKASYWWGILQAIGVAYFMGAASMRFSPRGRWILIAVVALVHGILSWQFNWWLELGDKTRPFLTIANLSDFFRDGALHPDPLRPLTIHCTPWASISYGLLTIVGTLLGEAIVTRDRNTIYKQCLLVGIVFTLIGYLLHRFQAPMHKDFVSPSYSIFTSGIGAFTFLLFYWIIDVNGFKKWAWALNVFGANALLAYFMQPVVRIFVKALGLLEFFGNQSGWEGVYAALVWTALLWCVVLYCNKKNVYWKL